jgi:aldehyde dehydrogenase (NAD+)
MTSPVYQGGRALPARRQAGHGRGICRRPKLLHAGTVWVNTYRAISYMMPFGGMKHSGVGRESGIDAVREYLETKSVWISTATDVPANPFVMR